MTRPPAAWSALLLAALLLAPGIPAMRAAAADRDVAGLAQTYRQWLEDVRVLLSKKERRAFLALEKDYQRDAFIERFWRARDPYPETARNEFKDDWYQRLDYVRANYRNENEDRARVFLLQGAADAVFAGNCQGTLWQHEVWHYGESARRPRSRTLIFYQDHGVGTYELWDPNQGLLSLFGESKGWLEGQCQRSSTTQTGPFATPPAAGGVPGGQGDLDLACALRVIDRFCPADHAALLRAALTRLVMEGRGFGFSALRAEIERPPEARDDEWLADFAAYTTDLPEAATTFPAELAVRFEPGKGGRIGVVGDVAAPAAGVTAAEVAGRRSYDFELIGETFRGDDLLESFRYRFDVAAEADGPDPVPLSFRRDLRPGLTYRFVVRVQDLHSNRYCRLEKEVTVPEASAVESAEAGGEGALPADTAGEAPTDAAAPEAPRLRLRAPADLVVSGMVRVDAEVSGEGVARVAFFLDGTKLLTRGRPPFSVELDLGKVPRPHTVRAVGLDAAGHEVAADEVRVNLGDYRFTVKVVEPAQGSRPGAACDVQIEVHPPEDKTVERVELFVGEDLVATLYQPPYVQHLKLPAGPAYVRAVAYLDDGRSGEDLSFVNAPAQVERVDVRLVELYVSALDAGGHPVEGLTAADFKVLEDGAEQQLVRFEQVRDRPISVAVLFDTSASMEERLPAAREAAGRFLAKILTAKDRGTVVAFSERANTPPAFTDDVPSLIAALAALKAGGGTALYDSLVLTLVHFNGVQGQRAVLLLSDGKDRLSHYRFDDVRTLARTSGVAIYAIGLDLARFDVKAKHELGVLADESGGRSFFLDDVAALDAVYATIENELRSRYLLVYQSPGVGAADAFRAVEVRVTRPGVEVKAPAGYFP